MSNDKVQSIMALKPCPFCGNETPEFERMGTPRQSCVVRCGNCGALHESGDEGEFSGASWNERAAIREAIAAPGVAQGWVMVPKEPTPEMWGELARDIVWWMYMSPAPHYGSKLHTHLTALGREIPDWLAKEIPDVQHTPPKGTVAACIYKAMLAAAPSPTAEQERPPYCGSGHCSCIECPYAPPTEHEVKP